jgi:phage shock protein A
LPKLAELLEQLRSGIAGVAQSRERVRESMTALAQAQAKLGQQAETARRFGREDLAQAALARQEAARSQLASLAIQHGQLLAEEASLTTTAQALQAKIDTLSRLSEGRAALSADKGARLSLGASSLLSVNSVQQDVRQRGRATARMHDRIHRWLAGSGPCYGVLVSVIGQAASARRSKTASDESPFWRRS